MPKLKFLLILLVSTFAIQAFANNNLQFKINGLQGDLQQNAESRVKVLQESLGKEITPEEIDRFNLQAPDEIRKAIEPYGYFKSKIQSNFNAAGLATFDVVLGPPLKITVLDVSVSGEGENNPAIQKFLQRFPLRRGMIFQTPAYEAAKEKFLQAATNAGFVKATLEPNKVLIDLNTNQAKIIMHMQTGTMYYFGNVTFEDNPYDSEFLSRFAPFGEYEPFSTQKLIKLQEDLSNSFYFKQILVTPDFDHPAGNRIPIKIAVLAPKSQRYAIGFGWGNLTGFRFSATTSLRRLTATGQHLEAQLKLSEILSGLGLKYYIPGKNPLTDQWVFGTNLQYFTPQNGRSTSASVSGGYEKKIDNWQTSLNLNYLLERYKVFNENDQTETSSLLYPSLNATYIEADDVINPKNGRSLNLKLQGASRALLSSSSFMQVYAKGKYFFSPASFAHVILRGELGYTAVNDLKNLPLSMRFFAGGLGSIRGYKESGIGPGKYLEVGSVEYQNHLAPNWAGAVFYDFGTATNHLGSPLFRAAGIGVIYESMIGPVKLYVARPLDRPNKTIAIEFSVGPEF